MTRLAVTGATGRMGGEVLAAARQAGDLDVVLAVGRDGGAEVAGFEVAADDELAALLSDREPHVLVDFSASESSVGYVEAAARAGVGAVVGTTGFDDDGRERLRAASGAVPVLQASNFAPGLAAFRAALREAVARLPGYDVEITETHHTGKRDAPSGTAETLLADVVAAGGPAEAVHGRHGESLRGEEVGVHARRAGDVTGEHEVLLAGNGETVRLVHGAGDRGVFAAGALVAARWLAGREPGWYDFAAVLAADDEEPGADADGGDAGGEPA